MKLSKKILRRTKLKHPVTECFSFVLYFFDGYKPVVICAAHLNVNSCVHKVRAAFNIFGAADFKTVSALRVKSLQHKRKSLFEIPCGPRRLSKTSSPPSRTVWVRKHSPAHAPLVFKKVYGFPVGKENSALKSLSNIISIAVSDISYRYVLCYNVVFIGHRIIKNYFERITAVREYKTKRVIGRFGVFEHRFDFTAAVGKPCFKRTVPVHCAAENA